ncbi:uncharacterized protein C8A04DRAFT_28600 [Dichotomopilus funicola]|uniref:Uncharacterized protein n=1 Tax=Dichotomopilus funicola TaxID=1934379 RepID=A0AAN6ZMX1_9PEZI|nr:hypothetical protein C8A04DRAFT_28600 [Dichotomopilus funicola]
MSLTDQPRPILNAGHSYEAAAKNTRSFALSSKAAAFDEPIFDKFDDMDHSDALAPSPELENGAVPQLPTKSALRASRVLGNLKLNLDNGAVETAELGTPHDVYLSSEEDASSDADDFSDYDYDSSVEDPASPSRVNSREDTARVVSVVFAGKPSLVDLPATRKRPASSNSESTSRIRSSTESTSVTEPTATKSIPAEDRPVSPASTASSRYSYIARDMSAKRRSTFLSDMLTNNKKPTFLSIDPYANGSSYTLNIPKALDSLEGEVHSTKTPRTPTALFKGVTRSFSLSRKRSRPNLNSPQPAVPKLDTSFASERNTMASPATAVSVDSLPQQQPHLAQKTPQTPVTYTDILRAVKRNATVMGAPPANNDIVSPTAENNSPVSIRKGILSGLSAKRRSVKLMGKS